MIPPEPRVTATGVLLEAVGHYDSARTSLVEWMSEILSYVTSLRYTVIHQPPLNWSTPPISQASPTTVQPHHSSRTTWDIGPLSADDQV